MDIVLARYAGGHFAVKVHRRAEPNVVGVDLPVIFLSAAQGADAVVIVIMPQIHLPHVPAHPTAGGVTADGGLPVVIVCLAGSQAGGGQRAVAGGGNKGVHIRGKTDIVQIHHAAVVGARLEKQRVNSAGSGGGLRSPLVFKRGEGDHHPTAHVLQ